MTRTFLAQSDELIGQGAPSGVVGRSEAIAANYERLATCADIYGFYLGSPPQHALDHAVSHALSQLRFSTHQINFHLGAATGWRGKDEARVTRNLADAERNVIPGRVWVRRLRKLNPSGVLGAHTKAIVEGFERAVVLIEAATAEVLSSQIAAE